MSLQRRVHSCQGGACAAAATRARTLGPLFAASAEEALRAEADAARRQTLALNLVVVGELLRIFRRPVYALSLRR